jgi:phage gpG-like protein
MPPTTIGSGAFHLVFEIEGGDKINVALSRFAERLTDLREFWRDYVAPKFFGTIQRNFQLQGGMSESSGGWAPLSPDYEAWKAKRGASPKILRRWGAMQGSLTFENGRVGHSGIFEATPTSAVLGTRIPYATYHQRGGKTLPRRRVLFFPAGASENYGRLLHRYAVDKAKQERLTVNAS